MEHITNNSMEYNVTQPDIQAYFKKGFQLYMQNIPELLAASLIFWILTAFSFSFLTGPLIAGYIYLFVKKIRGSAIQISDLFSGFSRFFALIIEFYLINFLISVGLLFFIIPGFMIAGYYIFTEMLILDKNLGVFEAMRVSKEMTSRRGLMHYMGLNLLLYLILHIFGPASAGIGYLVLTPFAAAVYAVAYEDAFGAQLPSSTELTTSEDYFDM